MAFVIGAPYITTRITTRSANDVLIPTSYPGDQVYIPDKQPKDQTGATSQRHSFRLVPREKPMLRVLFRDEEQRPLKDEPYELCFMNGGSKDDPISGHTDGQGVLSHEIPPNRDGAEVWFDRQKLRWRMDIADLDPALDEDSETAVIKGVQARLRSLGFACGAIDGVLGPKTQRALKMFQRAVMKRENPDGQPDPETCRRLTSEHQC